MTNRCSQAKAFRLKKRVGDNVVGAAINKNGMLKIKTSRVGKETALAQIITVVEEAQGSKAPIQRIADRISGIFCSHRCRHFCSCFSGLVPFRRSRQLRRRFGKKAIAILVIACLVHLVLQRLHQSWPVPAAPRNSECCLKAESTWKPHIGSNRLFLIKRVP